MKNPLRNLLFVLSAFVVSAASGANIPGLDVIVKKNGKALFKGKTDTSGTFKTGTLEPGSYSVEFRAPGSMNLKGQQLAIVVKPGKAAPLQSSANGAHLSSGVAMTVDIGKATSLSGQVTQSGRVAAESSKAPEGYEKVKGNMKIINGKRHVWVPAPIGSNMGGRWVEEGTEGAVLSTSNKKGGDAEVLQKMQDQASNVGDGR